MTTYAITVNQSGFQTANGDYVIIAPNVSVTGGIDMRGYADADPNTLGGDQYVAVMGFLWGGLNDYSTTTSGGDRFYVGPQGAIVTTYEVIQNGGGGNTIINDGSMISNAGWGYAIYVYEGTGHAGERQTLINNGMISGNNTRTAPNSSDATIVMYTKGGVDLTNTGTIQSTTGYALAIGGPANHIRNTGLIDGEANVGGDGSIFDSRGGTVTGAIHLTGQNLKVYGGMTDDTITTDSGNDLLDGQGGADDMRGGAGNDTYVIDDAGDIVNEAGAAGSDSIISYVTLDMTDGEMVKGSFEFVKLGGTATIDVHGDSGNNDISGNVAGNLIEGGVGNDALRGRGGDDALFGNAGTDLLNGGTGADTMLGGAGNDTYYVDNLGDKVYETSTVTSATNAGGTDKVNSSVAFSLAASPGVSFVEHLTLTGTAVVNGTGNALANTLTGNGAANALRGASGNDFLIGGNGADILYGDANNDLLRGGAGNDILYGGSGNDYFRFDAALSTSTVKNVDQIKDFNPSQDTIQLENSIFTKFGASVTGEMIGPAFFRANTTGLAQDSNDYVVYETDTGRLYYDANGAAAGGSIQIALLQTNLALTNADFVLV